MCANGNSRHVWVIAEVLRQQIGRLFCCEFFSKSVEVAVPSCQCFPMFERKQAMMNLSKLLLVFTLLRGFYVLP